MDEYKNVLLAYNLKEAKEYVKGFPDLLSDCLVVSYFTPHRLKGVKIKRLFVVDYPMLDEAKSFQIAMDSLMSHTRVGTDPGPIYLNARC